MRYSSDEDYSLTVGILLSLGVHISFFFLLRQQVIPFYPQIDPSEVIDVSVEPLRQKEEPLKRQIIENSESEKITPKEPTNKESDQDTYAPKEQIKRGEQNSGIPLPAQKQQKIIKPSEEKKIERNQVEPKEKSSAKVQHPQKNLSLKDLSLSSSELMGTLQSSKSSDLSKKEISQNYKAFSRPMGTGALFMVQSGSADYLPNLPDGDITLLNAKANQFAVFVRRVAVQVFTQIRSLGWDNLSASQIEAIKNDTTIIATMSASGAFISAKLESSSSSGKFDEIILQATKNGTKDSNPPAGAKSDSGDIRFIFKSRSWVEMVNRPGTPPSERRWILLSTGLE